MSLTDLDWDWRLRKVRRKMVDAFRQQGVSAETAAEITDLFVRMSEYTSRGEEPPPWMAERMKEFAPHFPDRPPPFMSGK